MLCAAARMLFTAEQLTVANNTATAQIMIVAFDNFVCTIKPQDLLFCKA